MKTTVILKKKKRGSGTWGQKLPLTSIPFLLTYLVITWAGIFAVRLASPSDLMDNDQQRPAAYVLDVLVNGNWLVQTDDTYDITSKPPLYTWFVSLTALAVGRLNEFTLYLPGALAVLGVALVAFFTGARFFGAQAAFLGALAWLLSSSGFKQVHLARTDALFALLVFASAIAGWRAWRGRSNWIWFWFLCALSTLTKGPLGLLLAAFGLIGMIGTKNDEDPRQSNAIQQNVFGLVIYLVICGGWFFLAWLEAGQPLIDKMIGKELVGHAVESGKGQLPLQGFYKPPLYYLSRFLPWSLGTLAGLFLLWRHEFEHPEGRRFFRFLAAYFLIGLALFSAAPHQRWDHQFPLIPAGALIAGLMVYTYIPEKKWRLFLSVYPAILAAILLVVLGISSLFQGSMNHRTRLSKQAAAYIRHEVGAQFPIMHVDATMGVQFYLGTMRHRISHENARLALSSDKPAYVLVHDEEDLEKLLRGSGYRLYEINQWTEPGENEPFLRLVGNRPNLRKSGDLAFFSEGMEIQTTNAEPREIRRGHLAFVAAGDEPRIELVNLGEEEREVFVTLYIGVDKIEEKLVLRPGESAVVR